MAVFRHSDVDDSSGLAFDEAMAWELSNHQIDSMLRLYNYQDHCVLLGRFQRIEAEVDLDVARNLNVKVNRRPTGGGAILMGKDQLGIAYVTRADRYPFPKLALSTFADAICEGIGTFGLEASLRGKNDIEVDGRKIAGLGVCKIGDSLLLHASVLLDFDIELMLRLLRIPASKLGAHGATSVAERTTTFRAQVPDGIDAARFEESFISCFEDTFGVGACEMPASKQLLTTSRRLTDEKYSSDWWLFGGARNDSREFLVDFRSAEGTITLIISRQGDVIKSVLATGDYLETPRSLLDLENALRWSVIDESVISERLSRDWWVADLVDPTQLATAICASFANGEPVSEPRRIGSCYIPEGRLS